MSKADPARDAEILGRLYTVIQSRRGDDPKTSRTAKLFAAGTPKIAQKVGEEATETVVAALAQGEKELISESADLLYHLLVLWADRGVTPAQIFAELAGREGKPDPRGV